MCLVYIISSHQEPFKDFWVNFYVKKPWQTQITVKTSTSNGSSSVHMIGLVATLLAP